jgi:hypothetical protein
MSLEAIITYCCLALRCGIPVGAVPKSRTDGRPIYVYAEGLTLLSESTTQPPTFAEHVPLVLMRSRGRCKAPLTPSYFEALYMVRLFQLIEVGPR